LLAKSGFEILGNTPLGISALGKGSAPLQKLGALWRLATVLLACGLWGCGANSKGPIARGYSNFHAFFNGYYHANVRYRSATRAIEKTVEIPTQGYLSLIDPPGDKPGGEADKLLDEAIKKCDFLIWRRKKSVWIDDARLLIGKCWYHKRNYPMASLNFDYIRFTYKKSPLIPEVMLWQAKVQYQNENYYTCKSLLAEVLQQANAPGRVRAEASLMLADLLVRDGEYSRALAALEKNEENIQRKRDRARVQFLMAQLYDKLKLPEKAVAYYTLAMKSNYSDAMAFKAQLNVLELQSRGASGASADVLLSETLKRMERESRFSEFLDEIHYLQALRSLKEKQYIEALGFLKKSLARSKGNKTQKALSYFRTAEIYFSHEQNLEKAQAFYDSAATVATPELAEFNRIKSLSRTLKRYVELKRDVHRGDSLLYLASLNPAQLEEALEQTLDAEELQQEQKEAQQILDAQKQAEAAALPSLQPVPTNTTPTASGRSTYYFENPQSLQNGMAAFIQKFGNRANEDNWRRRSKEANATGPSPTPASTGGVPAPTLSRAEQRKARAATLRNAVPADTAATNKLTQNLAADMGALAAMFAEELGMPDSARKVHLQIIKRFAGSLTAARSYYALHRLLLTAEPQQAHDYADIVLRDFPRSTYATLIRNEGKKTFIETGDAETAYEGLYFLFNNKDYRTVLNFSKVLSEQMKEDPSVPKVLYLRAMAYAKIDQPDSMLATLQAVVKAYGSSEVGKRAQQTLTSYRNRAYLTNLPAYVFGSEASADGGAPKTADKMKAEAERFRDFAVQRQPHETLFGIVFVDPQKMAEQQLNQLLTDFMAREIPDFKVSVNVYQYGGKHLAYVAQFFDFRTAFKFVDGLRRLPDFKKLSADPERDVLFATSSNFRMAFAQKRFSSYVDFFQLMEKQWRNDK